jgi:hypothetical protein
MAKSRVLLNRISHLKLRKVTSRNLAWWEYIVKFIGGVLEGPRAKGPHSKTGLCHLSSGPPLYAEEPKLQRIIMSLSPEGKAYEIARCVTNHVASCSESAKSALAITLTHMLKEGVSRYSRGRAYEIASQWARHNGVPTQDVESMVITIDHYSRGFFRGG